ncbi:hypothetical protein GOODEAATRI_024101, partial [Goodea atripinnis]
SLHVQHLPGIPGAAYRPLFAHGDRLCCLPCAPNGREFHAVGDVRCWVLVVTQWFPFQCYGVYPCWVFCSQIRVSICSHRDRSKLPFSGHGEGNPRVLFSHFLEIFGIFGA